MKKNLKLLIGGSSSKIFHLKEFSNSLERIGVECKLVFDTDYADGFPSRNFGNWLKSDKKFEKFLSYQLLCIQYDQKKNYLYVL